MKRFGIACLILGVFLVGCVGHEARQQRFAAEFQHPFIAMANGQRHFVASYNDLQQIMKNEPDEVHTFILGELAQSRYDRNIGRMFAGFGYREIKGEMLEGQSGTDDGAAGQDGKRLYSQTFAKPRTNPDYNSGAFTNLGFQIWNLFR